jgi:histidine triad (HIT) family protein
MSADCIFCKIVDGTIPAKKIHEDGEIVAFHDVNPQAPVHALIIPRRHIESLNDASAGDGALLGRMLLAGRELADRLGISAGYRIVVNSGASAGQSVFHLHVHLLGGRLMRWPPG